MLEWPYREPQFQAIVSGMGIALLHIVYTRVHDTPLRWLCWNGIRVAGNGNDWLGLGMSNWEWELNGWIGMVENISWERYLLKENYWLG